MARIKRQTTDRCARDRLRGLAAVALALAAGGTLPLAAAAGPSLVVGQGWAYACERIVVDFTNVVQDVPLPDLPPETDPLSLLVMPVSSPVELVSWRKPVGSNLVATLATDLPRRREFDVGFLVRGPDWRASYQLVVRSDPEHEDAPVSMDVAGRITVFNRSGGSWSNASLRVVGADPHADGGEEHGFLELDDSSPLADLWRDTPAHEATPFAYALDRAVTLLPGQERSFTFVSTERRMAQRRYLLTSDDIALGTSDPGRPLRHVIVLPNDAEHGLGSDLPGGRAHVFIGSVRATLGTSAWLSRTPAGGEIRIELGDSGSVRGLRRIAGREPGTPGQVEENFEIEIRNQLGSVAPIEVEERPPARQDWAVVRSSQPYEIRNRRLRYRLEIPARDRFTIRYTIRVPKREF